MLLTEGESTDLQDKKESHLLTWSEVASGPPHQPTWTIECKSRYHAYINADLVMSDIFLSVGGEVKGSGAALSKSDAKQTAAKEALAVSMF
jgi:dsRNA-specific ribonuclease